jgi:hypothetical protein
VVVATGVDVFKSGGFVVVALGIRSAEEKALDLVGGVERVAFFLVQRVGVALQDSANVRGVRCAVLVDDVAENKNFARTEDVGGSQIEGTPIHGETKVAFALGGEPANGRAVEGEVVPALDEELLVVIEHVQAALEVAEEHGDSLDALFVGEILEALFLNVVRGNAVLALYFRFQIQLFQLVVRKG